MVSAARSTSLRAAAVPAAVALVALVLGGCGGPEGTAANEHSEHSGLSEHSESGTQPGHPEHGGAAEEPAGASGEPSGQDGHGGHAARHASSSELDAMLVTAARLPDGYRAGHAHGAPVATGRPDLDPECLPLAELIGSHPTVRQATHAEAERVFSKSHFGPTVGEVIIDFGDLSAAAAAVDRLDRAAQRCDRYVQSRSRIGANVYTVHAGSEVAGAPTGRAVQLRAVGSQFDPIRWDVWWAQYGGRVVAVSFRSAPGGDNADHPRAVRAALAAL